jgi:hypothetical protein
VGCKLNWIKFRKNKSGIKITNTMLNPVQKSSFLDAPKKHFKNERIYSLQVVLCKEKTFKKSKHVIFLAHPIIWVDMENFQAYILVKLKKSAYLYSSEK